MSLTSSLYTGTSGLTNMGNSMQVIGDNISNVNTVGFKGNRSLFADLLNQSIATQSGSSQVGRGTAIQIVDTSFQQGSFESTGNTTDLSIGGNGFFQLRDKNSQQVYYTRAGNFTFDKNGQLINPDGFILQGWELDEETGDDIGAIKDIVLDSFTSPPKKTDTINMVTNLDADAESQTIVLANAWDSTDDDFIAPNNYEYQSVVKVYDSLGSTHDLTIYYDKKAGSTWEYLVTCNPDEDQRNLVQGTSAKGLLARGEIKFNESDGSVRDMTMEKFTGIVGNVRSYGVNKEEDITFRIEKYDSMALDGFDFHLEFDGNTWKFQDVSGPLGLADGVVDAFDKPANYPNAEIMTTSNEKKIEIRFDPDLTDPKPEPDLVIYMDNDAAATDSLHFDINRTLDIHKQDVTNLRYEGDTGNDNTTLMINDPSAMIRDVEDMNLVWDPINESWYLSYPTQEGIVDNNLGIFEIDDGTGTLPALDNEASITVNNPEVLTYRTGNINAVWSGTNWYFEDPAKFVRGTGEIITTPTVTHNNPSVFTKASTVNYALNYDGSGNWSFANIDAVRTDYPAVQVLTASSDENQVQIDFDGDNAADLTYAFAAPLDTTGVTPSTMSFKIDPFPNLEYPGARIITTDASNFAIDFDGNATPDMSFSLTDTLGAPVAAAANNIVTFNVDPRAVPEDYPNAVVKGDKDSVYIDLDGSGGENDTKDVVFTFTESLGTGTDAENSLINFDLIGGTSWTEIEKADIATEGYFSFMADFLGATGEFGPNGTFETTEQDMKFDIGVLYDGISFKKSSLSTTQYAKSSSTTFQSANGYGAGDLEGVNVSGDGMITGVYSNGEQIPLYRVSLAKFLSDQGLYKEGGNLYRETRSSGDAITGKPGENGLGSISPNSLEMSNVDIADEFVSMITTQRGFQANSKIVTTVDDMLSEVINMKR
ncbi:MAG: flagellar hook-basal body complex protein [Desulfobacteraceae bacterium]|nr:flagellar hook-basal body complex protein [Desulfobacteraceae bacterium]